MGKVAKKIFDPLGLFTRKGSPDQPDIPTIDDEEVEAERRRQLALRNSQQGRAATNLTQGSVSGPILGTQASILGGGL